MQMTDPDSDSLLPNAPQEELSAKYKLWDPRRTDTSLHNVSGVNAHEKVKIDQTRSVGKGIIESIICMVPRTPFVLNVNCQYITYMQF